MLGQALSRGGFAVGALLLSSVAGCAKPEPDAPVRSPSYDYGRTPLRLSSDDSVVGVDGKDPQDRAEEVGGGGWYMGEDGVPRYDPERRVGGHVDKKFEPKGRDREQDGGARK